MFKTTGIVNREFYDKIKTFFFPLSTKIILALYFPFATILNVYFLICHSYISAVICISLEAAVGLQHFRLMNQNVDLHVARLKEMTGMDEVECTVYFDDDGVVSEDNSPRSPIKIKYCDFKKIEKARSCYLIISKAQLLVPVFVDCLSDEAKNNLLAYLKECAPQLKC